MARASSSAPQVIGAIVGAAGILLLLRWAFGFDWVSLLIPGSQSVSLTTQVLLVAAGLGMFAHARQPPCPGWRMVARLCSATLILLPLLAFADAMLNLSTGVNVVSTGIAAAIDNRQAGRQSPNAGLAFLCAGLALRLLRRPMTQPQRLLYLVLVTVVAAIGLGGLLGYLLGLESLYRLASFNRLLPATAMLLALISAGMWALYERTVEFDAEKSEARIAQRTGIVITLVALGAGAAGFGVLRENFEQVVSQNMLLTARTTATSLAHAIEASLAFPRLLASRPELAQGLAALEARPQDAAARQTLQRVADSFLGTEIGSVRLYNSRGEPLLQAGSSLGAQARVLHPLAQAGQNAALAWQQGYLLLTTNEVQLNGAVVGRIAIEQRLPLFDRLLAQVRASNDSSDCAVCSRTGANAICGPTRFRPQVFTIPMFNAAGEPALPVIHAVLGSSGVMRIQDLRGIAAVSAYAPLKEYGLGLAVKTDVETLYAPLRSQLQTLALWLLLIVALAVYAQRSQVRPLLRQVVANKLRLRAILDEQSELVSLAKPDGELSYVNPAYARYHGWTPESAIGHNLLEGVAAEDREAVQAQMAEVLRSGKPAMNENRLQTGDGQLCWVAWTNSVQKDPSGATLLHSVGRDITQRKRADLTLQAIAEAFPALVAVVGNDGHYRFANRGFERWAGRGREDIVGRHMREVLGTEEYQRSQPWVDRVLAGQTVSFEKVFDGPGAQRHMAISYIPLWLEQQVDGFVAVAQDITQHKQEEIRLLQLTRRDPLTGLLNRAGFEQYLQEQVIEHAERGRPQLALLYIDLDRFKPVNDTHGHRVGDQVLQLFASRLQQSVRPSDAVARMGGDEFAIALAGVQTLVAAQRVAEKVIAAAQAPFEVGTLTLTIGASVGIAFDPAQASWQALEALADEQLYRAKAAGRGRHASNAEA